MRGNDTKVELRQFSLVDQAVARLREEIIGGELLPGTKLSEVVVSERLGIARPTVREVLLKLQGEGLVQRRGRNSPLSVTSLERGDVIDIYAARLHLELAGARAFSLAAPPAQEEVERSVDALEQAASTATHVEQQRLDVACHTAIVALTGSPRLVATHLQILGESRLASIAAGSLDGSVAVSNHREFVTMLHRGEVAAACDQLTRRLDGARDRVLSRLRK